MDATGDDDNRGRTAEQDTPGDESSSSPGGSVTHDEPAAPPPDEEAPRDEPPAASSPAVEPLLPPGSTTEVRAWWQRLAGAVAVAVVTVFLLQLVRLLVTVVGFALPAEGVDTGGVVRALLLPAVLGLLAPLGPRLIGGRFTILGGAALVGLFRFLELQSDDPGSDRWLATLGIAAALWTLSALLAAAQDAFAHGIVLGLAVDAAIRGVAWTVDLSWQSAGGGTWLVVGSTLLLLLAAWLTSSDATRLSGPDLAASLPLLALGPLLFLELLILQNLGWIATTTGWSYGIAFLLLGVGNALHILGTSLGRTMPGQNASGLIGGVLLLLVTVRVGLGGVLAALLFLAAHLGAGMVIGAVTAPVPPPRNSTGTLAHAVLLSAAGLLFGGFVLAFELRNDLSVPLPQELLVVLAGALVVIFGLGASVSARSETRPQWIVVLIGLVLVAVPVQWIRGHDAPDDQATGEGLPRRVATYDAGFAIGPAGVPDLEGIAEVVEATGATVIGLQDVPRGRLLSGSIDVVAWLQQQLGIPYAAFHATTDDPLWGNAILSRLPLEAIDGESLPASDAPLRRGVLAADVDAGGGVTFRFLVTKLSDTEQLEDVHTPQMERLLEVWDGQRPALLVGNFNAAGGTPATDLVTQAGFLDGWAYAGEPPGHTAPAADPAQRVDWLFHTDDLRIYNAEVIDLQVSDHLAVAATVRAVPPPEEAEGGEETAEGGEGEG